MFLSNLSIKRPVFATVLMLGLVTLGLFSYRRLAIDLMPDIEIPVLSIVTEYPGASPETVEREVTKPIEEAVNPISGVKHVSSVSREGLSSVVVEFDLEVKINEASQDARAKINAIRNELPETMKEPVIQKLDFGAFPIVSLAVRSTNLPPRELTTLADRKIKRRLENIPGVGKVKLVGSSKREVDVNVDPARIEALGMGVDEIVAGLRSENVNTPLGRLNRGTSEMPLRIAGKPGDVSGFESMVVGRRGTHTITLGEVAEVVDGVEEERSLALVNGVPAVALNVLKQSKANVVQVVDEVKRTIAKLGEELPPGTEIAVVRDSSIFIRESVDDVQTTLLIGGLLTVLIVFCFLNSWRSTVITGLTLPISVISSFIAMYFLGMTMNTMTLMALSLAIGLLIDDAIVVRENIVRHLERGEDHFQAARDGTSEIGLAVLATTLSIVAVFVPVAFMKGVVGRFFFQFGITVTFSVMVSLFVSFTLDPMLSSRWYDPAIGGKGKRLPLARLLERFNDAFDRIADRYKAAIAWALDHRKTVVGGAAAAFVAGLALFAFGLQSEFFPVFDRGEFNVRFRTAPGSSIEETKGRLAAVLHALEGSKEVEHSYATIAAGDSDTVRDGLVYVKLSDRGKRERGQGEILAEVRSRVERIPGIVLSVEDDPDQMQKPLQVLVRGDEIPKLKEYAAALKGEMYRIPGVVDLEASMEQDLPEYRLAVNRERASEAGLRTESLVRTLGVLVGGQAVSTYEDEEGEGVDVRVRLPLDLRQDVSQVGDLRVAVPVPGQPPALVPISDLVTVERTVSASEINRRDLARQAVVSANLKDLPLGTAAAESLEAASRIKMAPGYHVVMSGDTEIMEESFRYLGEALLLAIVFVYLILAAQFESFMDPLAIMFSLPLSIVGMAGMLFLTRDTVNLMSLIGLIMLMGLVTKNAILLVDFAKVLQRRGMSRREAVITAGRTRLRPILMTTLAMIFGMLPLALGIGAGAEWRAPMARAVVGGLVTSTLLTLLVVPVVYTVLDDLAGWVRRRWDAKGAVAAAIVALLAWGGGAARAETPPPRVLTLDEAVAIAVERNRDVQKAVASRSWIEGKYLEERAQAFPQVTLEASGERLHDESQRALFGEFASFIPVQEDIRTADVKVSQPLFTWGKVGSAIRAAKVGFEISEDQIRLARHVAERDASAAFYDILLAKEIEAIARQNLQQKERHLDEARRKLALGTATDYDVLAAEVAVENARPDTIRAASAVRATRDRLRFVLALEEPEVDAAGTLDVRPSPAPDYETALASALARRPELHDLAHRTTAQQAILTIARTGDKPRLDFRGSWGRKDYDFPDVSAGGKLWSAGIYMTFPFFDGMRTRGQVRQAESDLTTLSIDLGRARDAVALEVRDALDAVRESEKIVEALAGTVTQAERLLGMAEKGFELGVKTRLEVEDAQLNLMAARGNLARARRDYLVARINLDFVTGALGERASVP
ncbi:MAG: efflux RND transporter permease subunit, partial [Acidobacteriia bacterium]|nr:efflux RND transporter permease subunit [Terriglobia bacterium]